MDSDCDNDMKISCKGRLVFSQPLRLLVALSGFVVAAIGTAPDRDLLGIDTLIANILVLLVLHVTGGHQDWLRA